jgi:hypothetical protein
MATALSLSAWIQRQLTRHFSEAGTIEETMKVVRFTLFHVRVGSSEGDEIQNLELGNRQWDGKTLAKRFDEVASTHAAGLSGRQQFVLRAFYFDETLKCEQYPFGKAGESFDEGLGTEGPTNAGHMAQMMRHNEALVRINTVHSEALIERASHMLDRTSEALEKVIGENIRMFDAMKEQRIQQLDAEYSRQKELLEYQRKTEERGKLMALIPGLVNSLLGTKLIPEATVENLVFKQLKATLTPDQLNGLVQLLSPDQLAIVAPLLDPGQSQQSTELAPVQGLQDEAK